MARRNYLPRTPTRSNPTQELVDPVLVEIFYTEREFLDRELINIVTENQSLGGTMNAFRFEGELYSLVNMRSIRGIDISYLHPSLEKAMKRYVKRTDQLQIDMKRLRHALSMVISKCRHHQDVRDVLPDVIANKIPAFQSLDRIREEGFVLRDKPELLAQFNEAMDIALTYQANRLLY